MTFSYLGPCHTPAEVAAREAAAWCAGRDAASSHIEPAKVGYLNLAGMALLNASVSVRGLTPPADLADSLAAQVEAARREERDRMQASLDTIAAQRDAALKDGFLAGFREGAIKERGACIAACRKAVPRAHTYASENADIYRAGDAARDRCIEAIRARGDA